MTISPNWARAVGLPLAGIGVAATNVTLPVMADIDPAGNLIGFQGDFTFDSTVINFQNPPVSAAGLTSNDWNVSGNVLPGSGAIRTLRISAFANDGFTPLSGSGALFNINVVRVSNTPGTTTALSWVESPDDVIFYDTNLDLHRPDSSMPGNILISAAAVDTISLPKANVNGSVGNFTQPVTASLISPAANLIGFQGDFTFDSRVIAFQDSPVSGAGMTESNWNVVGNVLPGDGPMRTLRVSAFAMDGFTPLTGSGVLYNLNMILATKTPGANSALTWAILPDNFLFFDTDLNIHQPINAVGGNITVGGGGSVSISGNVSSLNPGPAPIADVMFNITGSITSSTQSDGSGNYVSALVPGGSYLVTPSKNPLNPGASGINNEDLMAVQADILMTAFLSKNEMLAADANGDGVINTVDAMAIQQFFVGKSDAIANVGKYRFQPATRSYSTLSSSQGGQNYDAFIVGDVVAPFARR